MPRGTAFGGAPAPWRGAGVRVAGYVGGMWVVVLLACAFRPPPEPPRWDVARGPVRVETRAELPAGVAHVVVRAGSAYDPSGREGLAFVTAQAIAAQVQDARVQVGPDVVRFELPVGRLPDLGRVALVDPPPAALAEAVARARAALVPRDCAHAAELAWRLTAYAGHPYGHAEAGRTSVLPTLTAVEAGNLARARYVREAVRVAVGDASTDALAAAAAALEGLPARISRVTVPAPRPVTRVGMVRVGVSASSALAPGGCSVTRAPVAPPPSPRRPDVLALALSGDVAAALEEPWGEATNDASPVTAYAVPLAPPSPGPHGQAEAAVEGSAAPDVISLEDLLR